MNKKSADFFRVDLAVVFIILIIAVLSIIYFVFPAIINSKEVSGIYDNLKYNYKTEMICKKNDSCTLKNFSFKGNQTKEYTFKLPQRIYFDTQDVEIIVMEGASKASHPVKSIRTVKYFVNINDYKYPVCENFQKDLKKALGISFFYDIPPKDLNDNINITIITSNSTLMWYFITFIGYLFGIVAFIYILLMVIAPGFFEKNLSKYFNISLLVLFIILAICLFVGLVL